jgi:hypothetical protein
MENQVSAETGGTADTKERILSINLEAVLSCSNQTTQQKFF